MIDSNTIDCEVIIKEFSKGILIWYNFEPKSNILYLYTQREDATIRAFLEKKGTVWSYRTSEIAVNNLKREMYDYIVGIDVLEESREPGNL